MAPIPVLKRNLVVRDFQAGLGSSEPQFLLELDGACFRLGAKSRALLLALLHAEGDTQRLEQRYAQESGEHLSAATLVALAHRQLPPALLAGGPDPAPRQPFTLHLALWPQHRLHGVTRWLAPLFAPRIAAVLVLLFVLLHAAVLPAAMQAASAPWSALDAAWLLAGLLLSGLWHELGHVSACRRFGCDHGAIGIGLYLVFPAWYADVGKAWRLTPRQRAVVDLGGVYFQSIQLVFLDAIAWISGDPLLWRLVWATTLMMLFTLNPVFKFDGYWLLTDLSGLPNLHQQLGRFVRECLVAALGRGRRPPGDRARNALLAAYAVLSAAWLLYIAHFLLATLLGLVRTLPAALPHALGAIAAAATVPSMAVAVLALAQMLAWPALLALACGAPLIGRVIRRLRLERTGRHRHDDQPGQPSQPSQLPGPSTTTEERP